MKTPVPDFKPQVMFGSLERKGVEGFGGIRLEEKIEKSFNFLRVLF